jgi:hypothetical protein
MTHLVRVSEASKEGLPFRPSTFYKWIHVKKHPEIFVKIGGACFVDRNRLDELIEKSRRA